MRVLMTLVLLLISPIHLFAQKQPFLIIGHAGAPLFEPENTLEGCERAIIDGANALEVDLCWTKDKEIVLWHDWNPDHILSLAKQSGLQGFRYRPLNPLIGSPHRRPIDELRLEIFRKHYGYTENKLKTHALLGVASKAPYQIPTFRQFATWLSSTNEVLFVFLDVKVPRDNIDQVPSFVDELVSIVNEYSINGRVTFFSPHLDVLDEAQQRVEEKHYELNVGCDRELSPCPILLSKPQNYPVVSEAGRRGALWASIGRPNKQVLIGGWKSYERVIKYNIGLQSYFPEVSLIACNVNDEEEQLWLIEQGVSGILCDDVRGLCAIITERKGK